MLGFNRSFNGRDKPLGNYIFDSLLVTKANGKSRKKDKSKLESGSEANLKDLFLFLGRAALKVNLIFL